MLVLIAFRASFEPDFYNHDVVIVAHNLALDAVTNFVYCYF